MSDALDRPAARRLAIFHALLWAFGAAQLVAYQSDALTGATRTVAGLVDYAALGLLMFLWGRLGKSSTLPDQPSGRVGLKTFGVLMALFVSKIAFVFLLNAIGLDAVTLVEIFL